MNLRIYKGFLYWGKKGEWFCDIFKEPFHKITDLKSFINDKIDCE